MIGRRKQRRALEEFAAKGYDLLATFNAEVTRGIVHTDSYRASMARIQQRFDAEHNGHFGALEHHPQPPSDFPQATR